MTDCIRARLTTADSQLNYIKLLFVKATRENIETDSVSVLFEN